MKTVEEIAQEIVAREGGFVDDPDDPGGATKHGVTLATLRRIGGDLNGNGTVDVSDLRAMSADRAAAIFIEYYYRARRIDLLPPELQPPVFDMCVNAGAVAVRLLQEMLNDLGHGLSVDGTIGPRTVAAARAAAAPDPVLLADAYGIARRNYYYRLADGRPQSRKYARRRDGSKGGWIRRAEEFLSPRFHLTEAEHLERTAAWG